MSFESFIEKFMLNMGITYDLNVETHNINIVNGICIEIIVYHKRKIQYHQHHCYRRRRDGKIVYVEGNLRIEPKKGILAYIGNEEEVHSYFAAKARELASNYLSD